MLPAFMMLNDLSELPTLPNHYEMDQSYGDNFEQIYQDHNSLIGKILWQEDVFIQNHQQNLETEHSLRE